MTRLRSEPGRHWLRYAVVAGALAVFAAGLALWRPVAVMSTLARAHLRVGGVRGGVAMSGPYRIHYLSAGSGRPVVLLHGLGGNGLQWGDYITVLAEDARVYAPDLLGYGKSEQPDVDYSVPTQTEVVRNFLDSLQVGPIDLVGLSMGGWIAADFARRYPERVRRLVLADSGGIVLDRETPVPFVPRHPGELPELERLLGGRGRLIPAFAARDLLRETERYRWVVDRFLRQRQAGTDVLDGKLASVTMPVLLVWGDRDLLSPLSQAEEFHRQIPQSELLILRGCGHVALIDCRADAQPEIRAFLASTRPVRGGRRERVVR